MEYIRFRPLVWTRPVTPVADRRGRSTFSAKWTETQAMLRLELDRLAAHHVVLAADFAESDIRADGLPRANARQPQFPGVEIFFDSIHGPLVYGTDAHVFWQHNVRAIALSLQALRAVDRYGVTRSSEQYKGWRALTSGTGMSTDKTDAARYVAQHGAPLGTSISRAADQILTSPQTAQHFYREAAKRLHPDTGGSAEAFARLQQAKAVLAV